MSITVTVSGFNGSFPATNLKVFVLTGAVESGGSQAAGSGNPATPKWSFTPSGSSSFIAFGIYNESSATAYTAAAGNTLTDNTVNNGAVCDGHYSGTVTGGTGITVGCSGPTGAAQVWASYEVRASGGSSPSIDASTPALKTTGTTSATTASFTPPAGSVLVAVASSNNSTVDGSVSDTSGLTWTKRSHVNASFTGTVNIWTATVPAPTPVSDTDARAVFPAVPGAASPGAVSPGEPPGTGGAVDGGESVTASLGDTDGTGSAADGGEQVATAVSDADSCSSADGGEAVSVQSLGLGIAMPSPAWLTRWGRFPRQVPLFYPAAVADGDAVTGADGGEFVSTGVFTGTAVAQPPPSWRAAYRHTARPQQPAFALSSSMTVTASVTDPGFIAFQGGSVLQVYVLDGATQAGGAADAEAIANQPGTGTVTPAFSGSFIPWVCFNDSQVVTANTAAANNAFDVNIPGSAAPVGAAGHYTGTVTAGTPVPYGLSSGTVGDEFVLAAVEVPPLVPGVPVTLDPVTPPGASDTGFATSLTSAGFVPPPGTVLVAVYGANNGGSADHCTFAIADSRGLAWTLAAVVNSGGNFLAAVWTATVPTFALGDTDAAGPASDFVSAATWTGQATVPDPGHGTDAGELVAAAVPDADACAGTDAAAIGITDADAGHGTESDPSAVAVAGSDAVTGTEAAVIGLASGETGHGIDAGELVAAAVPGSDTGHGADGAEAVAQADADAGHGADAGESLARQDFTVLRLPASPSFRARYRHTSRPAVPLFLVTTVAVADADHGLGEDSEIDNPFPVDSEAPHGADAGEVIAQADSDASAATDITFEFEFCHGTDLELTAWPSDADASLAFDTDGGNLFPAADADAGHGADGGEGVQQNVPKADSDASHAALDAGEQVTAAVPAADASTGADGGEFIPKDADAGQGTDAAGVASGLFADADFSLAFDVESRVLGPNAHVTDADASGAAADGGELPDVYAYQPPFRWTGGNFDVRRPEE